MYYLVHIKTTNYNFGPDLVYKTFNDKIEMYEYGAENHIFIYGPKTYLIIGPDGPERKPNDIYNEIERLKNEAIKKDVEVKVEEKQEEVEEIDEIKEVEIKKRGRPKKVPDCVRTRTGREAGV